MLVAVKPPWGPEGCRLFVQVSSTVEMATRLGGALARDAERWGYDPSKFEVTQAIRSLECFPQREDTAEAFLQVPPRTWVHLVSVGLGLEGDEGDEPEP